MKRHTPAPQKVISAAVARAHLDELRRKEAELASHAHAMSVVAAMRACNSLSFATGVSSISSVFGVSHEYPFHQLNFWPTSLSDDLALLGSDWDAVAGDLYAAAVKLAREADGKEQGQEAATEG